MKSKPKEDEDIVVKVIQYPQIASVYGGHIRMPDGRVAGVYSFIGPKGIEVMEVYYADSEPRVLLSLSELMSEVKIGDRTITLQQYVMEEILPYYYEKRKKK